MLRPSPNHGTQRLPNDEMMMTFGPLFAFHCPLFFTKNNNFECRDVLKTVTVTSDQKRFGSYTAHN